MKQLITVCCGLTLLVFLGGCVTTGPINQKEAFPQRNQDPRQGIVINEGTAHLNLYVYDEANRLIEQVYLSGANSWFTINDRQIPRVWVRRLEVGRYRIEVFPFYYQTQLVPPARYRIDLPKRTAWIRVNQNPTDYYYEGRHWAWILRLNGGQIPKTAHGLPGVTVNFWGDFDR